MTAGRPTKYTKELMAKARGYISAWKDEEDMIPSHVALQDYLGLSNTCMYEWAKDPQKAEFKEILDAVTRLQLRILMNNGLSGAFNSNITKLVLGKHGLHDKQDTKHSGGIDLSGKTEEELKSIIDGQG